MKKITQYAFNCCKIRNQVHLDHCDILRAQNSEDSKHFINDFMNQCSKMKNLAVGFKTKVDSLGPH